MAELSNAILQITLTSDSSEGDVEARIDVGLTPFEQFLITAGGLVMDLSCSIIGDDWINDTQYNFGPQIVTGSNTYTFARRLPSSVLNEDSLPGDADELFARYRLVSREPSFPVYVERNSANVVIQL